MPGTSQHDLTLPALRSAIMTINEFRQFSRMIGETCGIRMPESKKSMLESRLQKRLRALDLRSFGAYYEYLESPEGMRVELPRMIDVVTTNKTDFFREPVHFDYLAAHVLPEFVRHNHRPLRIWSAGCSSGEEPYTIAIVINEFAATHEMVRFSILATDICTTVLEKARLGVYDEEKLNPVSQDLKKKYFLRSKDKSRGVVRVVPALRSQVTFRHLNFFDEDFGIGHAMDVIFCRNVLIYFDRDKQEMLLNSFCRYLAPGGYIFLGHSETVNGLDVPLVHLESTIYRKRL